MLATTQSRVEVIRTMRRPKFVEIGTQMKLPNPRTRIQIPTKPIAVAIDMSKAFVSSGNIGAKERGPYEELRVGRLNGIDYRVQYKSC